MKQLLEGVGALLVIFSVGVPGGATLFGAFLLIKMVPQPWQSGLLFVTLLAAPFWMVVSVTWTFRKIESFLRWSKLT